MLWWRDLVMREFCDRRSILFSEYKTDIGGRSLVGLCFISMYSLYFRN
jgi:hypothetical protein